MGAGLDGSDLGCICYATLFVPDLSMVSIHEEFPGCSHLDYIESTLWKVSFRLFGPTSLHGLISSTQQNQRPIHALLHIIVYSQPLSLSGTSSLYSSDAIVYLCF